MARMTSKGQVTIPIDIREKLGLGTGTVVDFEVEGDAVILRKVHERQDRGRRLVAALRGRGDVPLSTEEIMALTRDG
jgi:antitoxin PrlF